MTAFSLTLKASIGGCIWGVVMAGEVGAVIVGFALVILLLAVVVVVLLTVEVGFFNIDNSSAEDTFGLLLLAEAAAAKLPKKLKSKNLKSE